MRTIWNAWGHFKTITKHKLLVMKNCFRIGLYRQGILHDMSKYSWEEFRSGVLYYQGNRSPNAAERETLGYSKAWLHHKGRNKHHYEYWIDMSNNHEEGLVGNQMPIRYVAEMMMDRIAASRVYKGKNYTNGSPLEYYNYTKDYIVIHPKTRKLLEKLLYMLRDQGEERTFAYLRYLLKKGKY